MDRPVLPQHATDERVEIDSVEWLFEPDWPGQRLIASVEDGEVGLTDVAGAPVHDRTDAAALLSRAVRSRQATLDGMWTPQPYLDEDGGTGEREVFVAIDLLELDGEPLLDVPLQERRRLLGSVLEEGLRVRISPAVKQPAGGWMAGWRRSGFRHYLARHQNGRYHPGGRTDDWLRIPLEAPAEPGLVRRFIGARGRGPRRIRD